jgi:hypothetical protein
MPGIASGADDFAKKMKALVDMAGPEEEAMGIVRTMRGERGRKTIGKAMGRNNVKDILVAEIQALRADVPEDTISRNAFLRSALFEIDNEKAKNLTFDELEDTKRMLEGVRRNLGFIYTSPPPGV